MIFMIDFMKTTLSAVKQYVESGLKKSVPDWNESDSDSINYIKNRTHYSEIVREEYYSRIVSDFAVSDNTDVFTTGYINNYREYDGLNIGKTYSVIWDGVEYNDLVCFEYDGYYPVLGSAPNELSSESTYPFCIYTDEEFIIFSTNDTIETSHDVKIILENVEKVTKIEEKYLPDNAFVGRKGTGKNAEIFNNYTGNVASGDASHAEGRSTIAAGNSQHTQGKFNIEDTADTYAHIVGNGSSSARSNAHTLDWDGNAWFAGNVYVGGTSQTDGFNLSEPFEIISSDTLTWDGNTDGLTNLDSVMYNTSDVTPTLTELQNGGNFVFNNVHEDAVNFTGDSVVQMAENIYAIMSDDTPFIMIALVDNADLGEGALLAKKGVYFMSAEGMYISSLTINGYTGFGGTKLKESYMPELITIADIDEICGGITEGSLAQSDVDELMAQLQ